MGKIKTSSAKSKGRRLQKEVMNKISEVTGIECGVDEQIASREMGQSGTDIRLVGEAKKVFPFAVECKNQEKWSIIQWVKQAQENVSDDLPDWLLFVKRNRQKSPYVVMDSELFFKLYKELLEYRQG